MMYCEHCGQQLADGARFCTKCGAPQAAALDRTVGVFDRTPDDLSDRTVNVFAPPAPKAEPAPEREPEPRPQPAVQDDLPPARHVTFDEPPAPEADPAAPSVRAVGPAAAIRRFFLNYANFSGRATRAEFWCPWLLLAVLSFLEGLLGSLVPSVSAVLTLLIAGALLLPSLTLCVRRLHDTGRSWTPVLLLLIPVAGVVLMIVFCSKPSDGDNAFGPRP